MKEKLLAISSSETEASEDSDDSLAPNKEEADVISDESNDSLVEKFLKNVKAEKKDEDNVSDKESEGMDDEHDTDSKKDKDEEESKKDNDKDETLSDDDKEDNIDENSAKDTVAEEEKEEVKSRTSRSSSKDDESKINEENVDAIKEDEGEPKKEKKSTNKLDRMDKLIFDKKFFNDIVGTPDEIEEIKDEDEDKSSANSDCEILDISMFKTNLKNKTMDDEKLVTILKNAQKSAISTKPTTANQQSDCISLSSDSDLELEEVVEHEQEQDEEEEPANKAKTTRRMLRTDQLAGETRLAQREESDRVKRLEKKNERLTQIISSQSSQICSQEIDESDIILDYDSKKKANISVHPEIVKHLKPHQVN